MIVTRNSPTAPALDTFLTAVQDQAHRLSQELAVLET
jgi:hypothetical protein